MAAHHGDGGGAQTQTHVPVEHGGQHAAQHVLEEDHDNGDEQEGEHLFAALLQQAEAGGVAHAGEEQGHEEVLHVVVKGELDHAAHIQGQVSQSEDQAAHHGGTTISPALAADTGICCFPIRVTILPHFSSTPWFTS